ncbi:hypothetical protein DERF_014538 [Dermatophagoides farinae]|uniref:Uncharacterized protein n=1 Tax=Dermatophagoides farinae TaxID=6954 RepID=A0A922KX09_DERFA|nr:hypothetical protein DERF_014538 [Dermatophagoides farinae]
MEMIKHFNRKNSSLITNIFYHSIGLLFFIMKFGQNKNSNTQTDLKISSQKTWLEWIHQIHHLDHLHPLIRLFIPYKSLQYFNDYYNYVRRIHHHRQQTNHQLYRFYYTIIIVHMAKLIHLTFLYLSRNHTDDMIKIIQGDISIIFQVNQFEQLLTIFPMILGLKAFWQLFYSTISYWKSHDHPERRYFIPPYKIYDYSAVNCIKWTGWSCANVLHLFFPILREYNNFNSFIDNYRIYCGTFIMIVCQGLMILLFIWIRLWQARNYLRLISLKSNIDHIQRSLKKFIKFQRQTISLIILVDRFYSKSFLLIMLISLPINIFAIIELICGNAMKFIIIILALHEWLIIFALHLLIATINERIKLSNKQMFGILARTTTTTITKRIVTNHQPNSFYFNWNCNCYLQTMYTQIRPYGFTYGSISLVSMQSFVLLTVGYIQGILFFYKLFNHL